MSSFQMLHRFHGCAEQFRFLFFLKLYTHGNMGMAWLVRFDCFDF